MGRNALANLFKHPYATDGKKSGADNPRAQHRHAGNGIARDDAHDQADHDCLDGDAKNSFSFLHVKETADTRIGVIALKKAKDKAGINERSDEKVTGGSARKYECAAKDGRHPANHRADQQKDKISCDPDQGNREMTEGDQSLLFRFGPQMVIGVGSTLSLLSGRYGIAFVFIHKASN